MTTSRVKYISHVENQHVYTTHLLEKHTTNTDVQRFAIRLV